MTRALGQEIDEAHPAIVSRCSALHTGACAPGARLEHQADGTPNDRTECPTGEHIGGPVRAKVDHRQSDRQQNQSEPCSRENQYPSGGPRNDNEQGNGHGHREGRMARRHRVPANLHQRVWERGAITLDHPFQQPSDEPACKERNAESSTGPPRSQVDDSKHGHGGNCPDEPHDVTEMHEVTCERSQRIDPVLGDPVQETFVERVTARHAPTVFEQPKRALSAAVVSPP